MQKSVKRVQKKKNRVVLLLTFAYGRQWKLLSEFVDHTSEL